MPDQYNNINVEKYESERSIGARMMGRAKTARKKAATQKNIAKARMVKARKRQANITTPTQSPHQKIIESAKNVLQNSALDRKKK